MTVETQYKQNNSLSTLSKKERVKLYNKIYYNNNKEEIKSKIKKDYPSKGQVAKARYYERNKETLKTKNKQYYSLCGKQVAARYRAKNKEKLKVREAEKRRTPKGKLRKAVISAFERIGKNKPTNTLKLLGCTWEEAKTHIESLWQEGMSWDNHGRYGWHIDHIRPVSSFEEHELDKMNHISNLQPLWAEDNIKKSDNY